MEVYLLCDSFNVDEEFIGKSDISILFWQGICISGMNWFGKFHGKEFVFMDKLPVDAGYVHSTVDESSGVNGFHGVQWNNQLNRDF